MLLHLEHTHHHELEHLQQANQLTQNHSNVHLNEEDRLSVFYQPALISYEPVAEYNFHAEGIKASLQSSEVDLPPNVLAAIRNLQKYHENRLYHAMMNERQQFVKIDMKSNLSKGMQDEMSLLFDQVHSAVEAGIWDGQYDVKIKTYSTPLTQDQQLVANIADQLIQKNMPNSLKLEVKAHHQEQETIDLVKRWSLEKMQLKEMYDKIRQEQNIKSSQLEEQRKVVDEQNQKKKQEALKKRIEKKQQMKNLQEKNRKKLHSQYLKMIAEYKKPVYKEKQQQFKKQQSDEQKQKLLKMHKLQQQKQSVSFEEIKEHMQRYEEIKDQFADYREEQLEARERQLEYRNQKFYKSKKYSSYTKNITQYSQNNQFLVKDLIQKKNMYSQQIKMQYMPKISAKKERQLANLIKSMNHQRKDKNLSHRNSKIEGSKNLQKIHQQIAEYRARGLLKSSSKNNEKIENQKKYINYMEEINKSLTERNKKNLINHYIESGREDLAHVGALKLEEKAKNKQMYLMNALESLDIDSHMKGKNEVEEEYMASARAKMSLIRKYNSIHQADAKYKTVDL